MLETYLNVNKKYFLSWESANTGYSYLEALTQGIHGSDQLYRKARKILNDGWENVKPLKSYGKVSGQQTVYYIKHRGSGIRAPFFQYEENVFVGIFVFYKDKVGDENDCFDDAIEEVEDINNWIQENEELYKKLVQRS